MSATHGGYAVNCICSAHARGLSSMGGCIEAIPGAESDQGGSTPQHGTDLTLARTPGAGVHGPSAVGAERLRAARAAPAACRVPGWGSGTRAAGSTQGYGQRSWGWREADGFPWAWEGGSAARVQAGSWHRARRGISAPLNCKRLPRNDEGELRSSSARPRGWQGTAGPPPSRCLRNLPVMEAAELCKISRSQSCSGTWSIPANHPVPLQTPRSPLSMSQTPCTHHATQCLGGGEPFP